MKRLLVAVAVLLVSVVAPVKASALYDANLSMKEATLLNAVSDLADEVGEVRGKEATDAKKLEAFNVVKKAIKEEVRGDIKNKKSCLKIKSLIVEELKEVFGKDKKDNIFYPDLVGYNAFIEANGDYAAAYCMTVKHP